MSQRPQHARLSFAERDVETSELFRRLAASDTPEESEQVVEQIVHLYLDLCSSMAGRYDGRGVEHEDLVQVARLALVKAVRRYEPGHAPSFAAYAVPADRTDGFRAATPQGSAGRALHVPVVDDATMSVLS